MQHAVAGFLLSGLMHGLLCLAHPTGKSPPVVGILLSENVAHGDIDSACSAR